MTLKIKGINTPSANVFMRMHWAKRKKMIETWMYLLLEAGANKLLPWDKYDGDIPRTLRVTRTGPRIIDYANCFLGVDKLLADNLVKLGVFKDDAPNYMALEVKQEKGKPGMDLWIS